MQLRFLLLLNFEDCCKGNATQFPVAYATVGQDAQGVNLVSHSMESKIYWDSVFELSVLDICTTYLIFGGQLFHKSMNYIAKWLNSTQENIVTTIFEMTMNYSSKLSSQGTIRSPMELNFVLKLQGGTWPDVGFQWSWSESQVLHLCFNSRDKIVKIPSWTGNGGTKRWFDGYWWWYVLCL